MFVSSKQTPGPSYSLERRMPEYNLHQEILWNHLRWFRREEFTSWQHMDVDLIQGLDDARDRAGIAFRITSDYRKNDTGPHGRGKAVDIYCYRAKDRYKILTALLEEGFTRIGVYDNHIHVDVAHTVTPVIWWGTSYLGVWNDETQTVEAREPEELEARSEDSPQEPPH